MTPPYKNLYSIFLFYLIPLSLYPILWGLYFPTCNRSIYICTQTEEYYVCRNVKTVYLREQTTRTPSLANLPIQTTPPGTWYKAPLHGVLPVLWTCYVYIYVYVYVYIYVYVYGYGYVYAYIPMCLRLRHNHHDHCTALSRARQCSYQVSDANAIIGIRSSVMSAVSDWIRLTFPSIWLDSVMVSIWLDSIVVSLRLDSIDFFPIQFGSRLTYLFSIRVTQFESHSSWASGSPTLARVSPKYSSTEIVEYSTILIIEIGFGKNTLTQKKSENWKYIHTPACLVATRIRQPNKPEKRALWGKPLHNSGCYLHLVEPIPLQRNKKKESSVGELLEKLWLLSSVSGSLHTSSSGRAPLRILSAIFRSPTPT